MSLLPVFIAWRYLRGKGSTILSLNARLSFTGIFVGTSLLVVVLSIFNGFQVQLKNSIFRFDPHITLTQETTSGPEKIFSWREYKAKIETRLEPKLLLVEGAISSPAIVRRKNLLEHVYLRAVELQRDPVRNQYLLPAYFPKIEEPANLKTFPRGSYCLVGREMAWQLGLYVGDEIEVIVPRGEFAARVGLRPSLKSYRIAGFFKTGHYQYDSRVVVMALEEAQKLFAIGDSVQQIFIRLKDLNELRQVKGEVMKIWPFSVRTLEEEQRNFFHALQLEKTIMTVIVFLFVIAAIVGIVVATYNLVHSHRRDIGILKAIGMSNLSIMAIFVLSGFTMGYLGTLLGIMTGIFLSVHLESILGVVEKALNFLARLYTEKISGGIYFPINLIPRDVYYFDSLPIHIDPGVLHQVGSLAIVLSALAALLPAIVASRLEPVKIIRSTE
ncbi:MAG: FtsX-like permease family protein [Leptospiraceae bacterium]|nr:FtsX-like permease family protein [Leptospiraceae bacterium]